MKITSEMVMYTLGAFKPNGIIIAADVLRDLANGEYTVDNWKSDIVKFHLGHKTKRKF